MTANFAPLLPGATIGIIGGGQLGRMLALEARRMGYRTCVLDPDPGCPAGQVADEQVVAKYDDADAARELAGRADVITYEFENVNPDVVAIAEGIRPVFPGSQLLRVTQHRIREKESLAGLGFPVTRFHPVRSFADLEEGLRRLGLPAVLKTATLGYDGKGQAVIHDPAEAQKAYAALAPAGETLILEAFVRFQKELSVVCARDARGNVACYPVGENIHKGGILDTTIAPARVPDAVATAAQDLAAGVTEKLGVVGLLAIELFLDEDGKLLINELAPRAHNSGHYTLDACAISQFEQWLRAICHLPLGIPDLLAPGVMVNLLGDIWEAADQQPEFARALGLPGVKVHLYGKSQARPGRKMGHLCAVAPTVDLALERALAARKLLTTDQ